NYLEGEPITAKPATGFYLLRKAAAKHRGALWVGFVLIVIASIAVFSIRGSMKKEAQVRVQANQLRGLEERVRQQEEENKQLQKQTASLQDERDAIVRQNNEAFDRFMASMFPSLSPEQRKPLINALMGGGAKEKLPVITATLQQLAADFVTAGGEKRQSKKYLDDPLGAGFGDEFELEPVSTPTSDAWNSWWERFQSIRITSPAADNSTTKPARKNDSADGDDGAN
ncbi:MAG: hypothetical protein O7D94_06035, partial [Planctomycetota bacterium]|nr:hypothetical protein [Planctomycetota bacterium]